ncbi:G-protein coupled receptor family C group 6 member A-like [Callorhinchus milii]|uniref:G-protein coupled receptor family C group 6 member A-like n=1 Tax=Callorhinchus milii TaxID=7868 RepID=UPI001C3FF363|nr:G-protein coupled receptor family C group 6 member A-like [Callorhinchus milii]
MLSVNVACFFLYCIFHLSLGNPCVVPNDVVGAKDPGDIILGGVFAVHQQVKGLSNRSRPEPLPCTGFDIEGFLRAEAMMYTIQLINNSTLLPGIKLGYEIYDTCADTSRALTASMRFLSTANSSGTCLDVQCNYTNYQPIVKAVVGEGYSELSISIARIFNLFLMPQVSYASSAEILSDKVRFPSFCRTVPSDIHQTEALARLVSNFHWNWIGIIATDDDYGQSAMASFVEKAQKLNICFGLKELIPTYIGDKTTDDKIQAVVSKIKNTPNANVIVIFAKIPLIIKLFTQVMEHNVTRTWIATDVWSTSREVSSMMNIQKIGKVFGTSFKNGNIPGFLEHLKKLRAAPGTMNRFLEEYRQLRFNCSDEYFRYNETCNSNSHQCTLPNSLKLLSPLACTKRNESFTEIDDDFLVRNAEMSGTYATYLAVRTIAYAIKKVLKCQEGTCQRTFSFAPWQLLEELRKVKFPEMGKDFYFNRFGDSMNGYDLINWEVANGTTKFTIIGNYDIMDKKIYIYNPDFSRILKKIFSKCSQSCKPGQWKIQNNTLPSCCYECANCSEGFYSKHWDTNTCFKCLDNQWSPHGSSKCFDRKTEFFRWSNGFAIVLLVFAFLGILLIIVTIIIFILNRSTPVVKAAGGSLCYLILVSLILSFASTGFFIGLPEKFTCIIRQPLFGISFTVCVSWILIKSFRINLAFKFDPVVHKQMKKLYKPTLILIICTGIQVIICSIWLGIKPPRLSESYDKSRIILLQCDEGSNVAFGVMLGYIAVLATFCFLLAFRGRKLPGAYNEARFITFSMLIYLIVWVSFVPVYLNTQGQYLPAVEMVAILASNYGILCCHFFPKCYIICFKKESNTAEEYMKNVRDHYLPQKSLPPPDNLSIWSIPVA